MTDDEWEQQRRRTILAAFQTGRPVFADTDGVLRYTDGSREEVPADVGVAKQQVPRATALAVRAERASHHAFGISVFLASANAVSALWYPWQFAFVAAFVGSAVVWRRVNRRWRRVNTEGAPR